MTYYIIIKSIIYMLSSRQGLAEQPTSFVVWSFNVNGVTIEYAKELKDAVDKINSVLPKIFICDYSTCTFTVSEKYSQYDFGFLAAYILALMRMLKNSSNLFIANIRNYYVKGDEVTNFYIEKDKITIMYANEEIVDVFEL